MNRHSMRMVAIAAVGVTLGLWSVTASAQEIRSDVADVRQDRRREDVRDLQHDRRDLHRDVVARRRP